MTHTRPFLLAVLFSALMFGSHARATDEHAAPAGSSVKILSTSPDTSSPLHAGDRVKLRVDVAYTLSEGSGTLSLVVQAADNSGVAQDNEVVTKGSGQTRFETEFIVPITKAILVFTPLSSRSQTSTSTVDMWAFKVLPK